MRAWLAVILVASSTGCFEDDDDGDCNLSGPYLTWRSSDTSWIEYVDSDDYRVGQQTVAVGGTERFVVGGETDCGDQLPATPLSVRDVNPALATSTVTGASVDVHGLAVGGASFYLNGGGLAGHASIDVAAIASVRLVGNELGEPGAFLSGAPTVKLLLLTAEPQPVVDRTLHVSGDARLGPRWNELAIDGLAVGDHPLVVTAGGAPWPVTLTIVDGIDDITPRAATITQPSYGSPEACFFAHRNGVLVAGVPWRFEFDPDHGFVTRDNCVEVWAPDNHGSTTVVTAHALGLTAETIVTFTP